ncbi:MAG: ribosome maturation factor RimP [Pseudomonadota bacterium]|nr:ribosome maturation factor RimP [Pseudomonadota bacterium]
MKRADQVAQMIRPTVEALGFELWGVEYLPNGKFAVLRIYIDHEQGISVDDCAEVSHHVSGLMDVEDPIQSAYTLEVSSPGMDRMLFSAEQYAAFVGETLKLRLRLPVNKARKFSGRLLSVGETSFEFEPNGAAPVEIAFKNVEKANVIPDFSK